MSYIDYVFDNKMYIQILKDIKSYHIDEFLLIGISVYKPNTGQNIKNMIKSLFANFNILNQQLWGYQRTIEEHIDIFNKAGFKQVQYGQLKNNLFWIKAINE